MTDVPSGLLPEPLGIALVLLVSLSLAALTVAAVRETLRERRAARGPHRTSTVLTPGHAVLRGIVRASQGGAPIRLEVTEPGKRWRAGHRRAWRELWSEAARVVEARPFDLVLASGVRVRVLASERTRVIAPIRESDRPGAHDRSMRAALSAGTEVWVEGELSRSRVGPEETWAIGGSRSRELFVSNVPPSLRHGQRAALWQRAAFVTGLLLAITQAWLATSFWPLALHGVRCDARIERIDERLVAHEQRAQHVHARVVTSENDAVARGTHVGLDVAASPGRAMRVGDPIAVVVSSNDPTRCVLGHRAGLSRGGALTLVAATALALFGLWLTQRRSLEWYDPRSARDDEPGPL